MRRLLVAGFLILAACSGGDDDAPEPTTTTEAEAPAATSSTTTTAAPLAATVTVVGGNVTASTERISVKTGEEVTFTVTSDVADEVHVHGYELVEPVGAGETVTVTFTANLAGVWEVELEDAGLHLLDVEVS